MHAVVHLGKRIENRTGWKGCSYRGPILLHAGKSLGTRDEFDEAVEDIGRVVAGSLLWSDFADVRGVMNQIADDRDDQDLWKPAPSLRRGGIVGRARIVGVVRDEESFNDFERSSHSSGGQRAWWSGGFALVLADVQPVPFVHWSGALGLFEVPDDYAIHPTTAA